ncbi:MAG TPA: BamA/TamA family outer membrane protein, partial [Opitutales bacterium]|nr:BamA/TamA family outer membrane protein [Opitutales bacterium]
LLFSYPITAFSTISLGASLQSFDVYNQSAGLQAILNGADSDLDFFGPVLSWYYDRTDDMLRPTSGLRLRQTVRWGLPVTDDWADVIIYEGRACYYLNPWADHVIQLKAGFETVDALDDNPVALPLRRFLGGPDDLRGFEYQTLSPYQNGIATGGQSSWWAGLEYTVPVFSRLDVSAYYQLGAVDADSWTFSEAGPASNWGIGFQLRADNFPIRVDVAFPIELLPGDPENEPGEPVVSFSAGYRF